MENTKVTTRYSLDEGGDPPVLRIIAEKDGMEFRSCLVFDGVSFGEKPDPDDMTAARSLLLESAQRFFGLCDGQAELLPMSSAPKDRCFLAKEKHGGALIVVEWCVNRFQTVSGCEACARERLDDYLIGWYDIKLPA